MDRQQLNLNKKPTYQELENQLIEFEKDQLEHVTYKDKQFDLLFDPLTKMVVITELVYSEHGKVLDFYIRNINKSFATFLCKTKDQLINKKISSVLSSVDDYLLASLASVDKTGTQTTFESYVAEFDKYYNVTAWKVSNNMVVASYKDITEGKQRKEEILASELVFDKIKSDLDEAQKLAKIGSWLFNPTTKKVDWSSEMFRIWGFDPNNGTPDYDSIVDRIHADDLDLYQTSSAKASDSGTAYDIELRIYHENGEQKTLRAIGQPVPTDSIDASNLKGINQDISNQKKLEEDLVKLQRLKAMGEMSSSIAHDFNNSLQEMMGNLDVVRVTNDFSGSTLERLNNIASIINDAAGRVTSLQNFADTADEDRQAELLDLSTMIVESLQQTRPLWKDSIEKKGAMISIETDFENIPQINGNRGELKSIFHNLIKNSVEAMPDGGNIIIKTGVKAQSVFVSLTDSGEGMDAETKSKIFQPYYSTKGLELGRGLGMSGVYSIVKKHGGDIAVKFSELGKGTSIEMFFPIQQGQNHESKEISIDKPNDDESLDILWIDDEIGIRESVSELLKLMGHRCETVNSGKNALQTLSINTFDVVFTDIGMPEMNGWELADAIRDKLGDKIKIVVVSGWDIEAKVKNQHDVNSTLRKPFNLEQLKETLLSI